VQPFCRASANPFEQAQKLIFFHVGLNYMRAVPLSQRRWGLQLFACVLNAPSAFFVMLCDKSG
jgi:hypothetical protein